MTTNKPEVVAHVDLLRGQEGRYVSLRGDVDQYSLSDGDELIRLSDYEALQAECESLRKDAERYRWLRDPCSGAERVVMYCRGDYGRGLMRYTMLDWAIDTAMQEETK